MFFLYTPVTSEHGYAHDAIYSGGLARFVQKDFGDTTAFLVFVEKTWSNPLSSGVKGLTNSSCAGEVLRPPSGKQLVTVPTMIKLRLAD